MKNNEGTKLVAEQYTETEWASTGGRIKNACQKAGFKLCDIARLLALENRQIYRIVKGELPCKTEYLYEISQALGVSTDYLLFGIKKSNEVSEIEQLCMGKSSEQLIVAYNILKAFFGEI